MVVKVEVSISVTAGKRNIDQTNPTEASPTQITLTLGGKYQSVKRWSANAG